MIEIPNTSFLKIDETTDSVALFKAVPIHMFIATGIVIVALTVVALTQLNRGIEVAFGVFCGLVVVIPFSWFFLRPPRHPLVSYDQSKKLLRIHGEDGVPVDRNVSIFAESHSGKHDDIQYTLFSVQQGDIKMTPFLRIGESFREQNFGIVKGFFRRAGIEITVQEIP